jgi:hypothetical protein
MRLVALLVAVTGCHAGAGPSPPAGGLTMHLALATAPTVGEVAIASAALTLTRLTAVSDRAAADARATLRDVTLALGDRSDTVLSAAPPGLYSAVDVRLGGSASVGVDIEAVWRIARIHATVASPPFDVACASPVRLEPGQRAQLTLRADPTLWFTGLDLGSAVSDGDDSGINISDDDNRPLALALVGNVVGSFALDCAPQ